MSHAKAILRARKVLAKRFARRIATKPRVHDKVEIAGMNHRALMDAWAKRGIYSNI